MDYDEEEWMRADQWAERAVKELIRKSLEQIGARFMAAAEGLDLFWDAAE